MLRCTPYTAHCGRRLQHLFTCRPVLAFRFPVRSVSVTVATCGLQTLLPRATLPTCLTLQVCSAIPQVILLPFTVTTLQALCLLLRYYLFDATACPLLPLTGRFVVALLGLTDV